MASVQDLKRRVRSVRNTRKITKAMELVASARLRRAQARIEAMRPYADRMLELMSGVARVSASPQRLPLLTRREPRTTAILAVTGDRGLAGGFNAQILRRAMALGRELEAEGQTVRWLVSGRKGRSTLSFRRYEVTADWTGFSDRPAYSDAQAVAHRLSELYVQGEVDRVVLVYNHFESALVQRVVEKAGNRLGLGVETTVAALAGPTGAGKSSLFNAFAGEELVEVLDGAWLAGDLGQRVHQRHGGAEGVFVRGAELVHADDECALERPSRVLEAILGPRVLAQGDEDVRRPAAARAEMALVESERPIWSQMSFSAAEDNLHSGAREGIDARVYWPGIGDVPVTELVLRRLLPLAHEGLERYDVDPHARDRLLEIIERRCVQEANGASWQSRTFRRLYEEDGLDRVEALRRMTVAYREYMHGNEPVHTWPLG